MRVMVLVKENPEHEAGAMPDEALVNEMGEYNTALVAAGVMVGGDGLLPSSAGKRVTFAGAERTVVDGPFAETRELVGGYWLWQVSSMEEAVEWLKRAPFTAGETVELRQIFELADFGDSYSPEVLAQQEALREQLAGS